MLKKVSTLLLIAVFMVAAIGVAKNPVADKQQKKVVIDESKDVSVSSAKKMAVNLNPTFQKAAIGNKTVIGTSFYDYAFNSGGPTYTAFWEGKTYMIFIGKAGAADPREIHYVNYDGTTFSTSQAVVPAATQQTYFSGVDVFRGGDANGIGAVGAGHIGAGNSYYGIESAAGAGGFSPTVASADRDVAVLTLNSSGTVLFKDSKGRTDYKIQRSTDFGQSWTVASSGVIENTTLPGDQIQNTLDICMFRFPNGDIGIGCTIGGTDNIAPTGEADPDSANQIGYFKSTDQGTTWTWHKVAAGGESNLEADLYNLWTNFDQNDWVAGPNNDVRMVANAYPYYYKEGTTDTVQYNSAGVAFWSAATGFKKLHSFDSKDTMISYALDLSAGNAYGCSYPSIAQSADGQVIVCTWSQPNWNGTALDTNADGVIKYDMWFNWSADAGATWHGATNLTETTGGGEVFGMLAEDLEMTAPNTYKARMTYIYDENGGAAPFDGINFAEDVVYHEWTISTTNVISDVNVVNSYSLDQNYPNPFNPSTSLKFSIPVSGNTVLKVYNTLGQEIATLVDQYLENGSHNVKFDASSLGSGVYLYKLTSGSFSDVKKMVLTK